MKKFLEFKAGLVDEDSALDGVSGGSWNGLAIFCFGRSLSPLAVGLNGLMFSLQKFTG